MQNREPNIHCNIPCPTCQGVPPLPLDITKGIEHSNLFSVFSWHKRELNRLHGLELGPRFTLYVRNYGFVKAGGREWVQLFLFYSDKKYNYYPPLVIGPEKGFFDWIFQGLKANCPLLKAFKVQDLYQTLKGAVFEIQEYPVRKAVLYLNTKILEVKP